MRHVSPVLAARQRKDAESTWAEVARVYTRGVGGTYSVVAKDGLRCSLTRIGRGRQNDESMASRAELATGRVLQWEYDYQIPENAQFEINGRRWNPLKDTVMLTTARPGTEPLYWQADVVRVP